MHSKNQKSKIGKLQEITHLRILRIDKKQSWRIQTIREHSYLKGRKWKWRV
jgi:hypothetical protein